MKTRLSGFRLNDDDIEKVKKVRDWWGLPSLAAAIRFAVHRACDQIDQLRGHGKSDPRENDPRT